MPQNASVRVCSPYDDGNAVFNYIFMFLFFIDSCLSFRVAIIENDILVTDTKEIAKNYLRYLCMTGSSFPTWVYFSFPTWAEHTPATNITMPKP